MADIAEIPNVSSEHLHSRLAVSTRQRLVRSLVLHALLAAVAFAFAFPLLFMVATSLKTQQQTFALPPTLLPNPVMWDNYAKALDFIPYGVYFRNSLIIASLNVLFTVASSALVAYSFAKIHWRGRDTVFGIVVSTMMIPYTVTLIPQFLIFRQLGWIGSFNPLIIPALAGHPFFIFLLRQFFRTIPEELSEAARLDGASEFGIFWRIILPLARPALATAALFTFLWNWNDFLGPLIYLNKQENYTLAIGLYSYFSMRSSSQWGLLMAAAVVMITPVTLLFLVAQRTFIRGISLSGLKV